MSLGSWDTLYMTLVIYMFVFDVVYRIRQLLS